MCNEQHTHLSNGRTIGFWRRQSYGWWQYEQYYHLILDLGYLYQYPASILNIGLGLWTPSLAIKSLVVSY